MPENRACKPIEILLVEDNPADVRLTEEVLKESRIRNRLFVVNDGVAAIDFLRQQGEYCHSPRPDLVLLDLNLPRKDGREVLADIKTDDELKCIPVVVMTTSQDERDLLRSYSLHANCYIQKPVDLGRLLEVVRSVEDFWLTIVRLPPK